MASKPLNGILKRVRTLAEVQTGRALADRELLARFVEHQDEAAFTVLIERHGPMVLGVCQRALRNAHDAEDACQATFLVFARKADSIRKTESLSSWLHGIACRIAANLKRSRIRAKKREQRVASPIEQSNASANWQEVQTILDEEVADLPERYRGPLLLCYWEGKTRDEAATQLSMTAGKLHGLLERGRELLRDRLTKRGLTLSGALCASMIVAGASNAALDPSLVVASTKAALLLASGGSLTPGLVSINVVTLTQEVLHTMLITKMKIVTASILCAGIAAALIGGSLASVGSAQPTKVFVQLSDQIAKSESDEAFIRRMSKDLRGIDPTPAEVHFFVANKDAGRRQKLIDLFIQERQLKQKNDLAREHERRYRDVLDAYLELKWKFAKPDEKAKPDASSPLSRQMQLEADVRRVQAELDELYSQANKAKGDKDRSVELKAEQDLLKAIQFLKLAAEKQAKDALEAEKRSVLKAIDAKKGTTAAAIQNSYFRSIMDLAREKKDVSDITQKYLESMMKYIGEHPKANDVPDAMLQIELIYRSLGKTLEANAWREKLQKDYPASPAAKMKLSSLNGTLDGKDAPLLLQRLLRAYDSADLILEAAVPDKK